MTTELDAVNEMLSSINEAPVNSLEGALTTDVASARNLLNVVRKEVQARAWWFNTDERVILEPDAQEEIGVGPEIIRVDGTPGLEFVQFILRGRKLYNRADKNFKFKTSVTADTTTLLVWDEVPPVCQRYIVVRSSRLLADRLVGSGASHQFSLKDEADALRDLKQWDAEHAGYNVMNNNRSLFDSLNRGIRGGRRV